MVETVAPRHHPFKQSKDPHTTTKKKCKNKKRFEKLTDGMEVKLTHKTYDDIVVE